MEEIAKRGVIQYLLLKGLSEKEIHEDIVSVLGEDAPSYTTIKRWVADFHRGFTNVQDDKGHKDCLEPATSIIIENKEIVDRVQDMIMENRRLTQDELAKVLDISYHSIHDILTNILGMKRLLGKWVPDLLTLEQKRVRVKLCQVHLNRFVRNKIDFICRLVTMDEIWVYHYEPNVPGQTCEEVDDGCPTIKRIKESESSKKILASVFWDAKGILLIDYLDSGKTITPEYYCSLLDQLYVKIGEKRPDLAKKKIIFHHDNAPAHKCPLTASKLTKLNYELLEHPPYSPDLSPSNFHLFPHLKEFLRGKQFSSNEEVIASVEGYFEGLPTNHFRDGIQKLESCWKHCIKVKGDYIEE